MTRKDKLLKLVPLEGRGLEIGPLFSPVIPKRDGYNVKVLDNKSRAQLINVHPEHADEIEEVDYVWAGQSYRQLIGESHCFDYILASHVIEHTPDLIGFLENCMSVLKPGGVLSLAVPDMRYCFDCFRPITGLAHVIDSYRRENIVPTAGTAAEYYLNVTALDGKIAWYSGTFGSFSLVHPDAITKELLEYDADPGACDLHAWVFTPTSFRLLMHDLRRLGFTSLKEIGFFPSEGCEFYITLSSHGTAPVIDRLTMLRQIAVEALAHTLRAGIL